jgi:hypothetical protein
VADPTSPILSLSTRLRFFEDDPTISSVDLTFLIEVGFQDLYGAAEE